MSEWRDNPRGFLRKLFEVAVDSAKPQTVVPAWIRTALGEGAALAGEESHLLSRLRLQSRKNKPITVFGAGKASAAMARAFEQAWPGPARGIVVTRYGHAEPCDTVEVVQAAHPIPDANGERAAARILGLAQDLGEDDFAVVLISGGGSALLALPAPGIALQDKQEATDQLLKSGASIHEINTVRKHLSRIKGGRLALACHPAPVVALMISDVPGDDPATIASGPTVPDPTTSEQAAEIIRKYNIKNQNALIEALDETPKPSDPVFRTAAACIVASPMMALQTASRYAESQGLPTRILSDRIEGEAGRVGREHAEIALEAQRRSESFLILSGGETTVKVRGQGRGGRNVEFLASFVSNLSGRRGVYALAADTDGIDGTDEMAGAIVDPTTLDRAAQLGLDIEAFRERNDCHTFFERLGDSVVTGPTRTNVNDFRAILVIPE